MSVRDGLLSILSLGPAYGLQLHAELASRASHRGPVNVGQVYATLERLTARGLVLPAGTTDDGLPLHAATERGLVEALDWQSTPVAAPGADWNEMLDQVLITASIDTDRGLLLVDRYRALWEASAAASSMPDAPRSGSESDRLAERAAETLATAALDWLGLARKSITGGHLERALSAEKPRRGRRPAQVSG